MDEVCNSRFYPILLYIYTYMPIDCTITYYYYVLLLKRKREEIQFFFIAVLYLSWFQFIQCLGSPALYQTNHIL